MADLIPDKASFTNVLTLETSCNHLRDTGRTNAAATAAVPAGGVRPGRGQAGAPA